MCRGKQPLLVLPMSLLCRAHRQIPTDVHLIVAADSPDSIAGLLLEKAEELDAAALVVASHGKQALQVRFGGGGHAPAWITCSLLLLTESSLHM